MSQTPPVPGGEGTPVPPASIPPFDAGKPHMARPKLRPLRGFPAQAQGPDGKPITMLGLADARQISDKMVMTMPATQVVLPLMDGSRDLDQIVEQVGRGLTRTILENLVAQLDDAGFLHGPVFDGMLGKMRADFDAGENLPPASSAQFAEALIERNEDGTPKEGPLSEEQQAHRMGRVFDQWMAEALKNANDPSLETLPKAIVVPHTDYPRGWINYANVWGRLRVADRPDRIVILGTNHFGEDTGVCGCDKGYSTPFGIAPLDKDLAAKLRQRLGDAIFAHRFDHECEHSIELQVPWMQHVFGKNEAGAYPKVFGALIHDPAVKNGESYDGTGVSLQAFVEALRASLAELPGKTLIVSSADLSHVGPAFGDPKPLGGEEEEAAAARNKVFEHDRDMLKHVADNKPWDLVSSMAWQQNPTRWCSTGNLVATLLATQPTQVRLLNYSAAMDQQGVAMVSSCAAIMS